MTTTVAVGRRGGGMSRRALACKFERRKKLGGMCIPVQHCTTDCQVKLTIQAKLPFLALAPIAILRLPVVCTCNKTLENAPMMFEIPRKSYHSSVDLHETDAVHEIDEQLQLRGCHRPRVCFSCIRRLPREGRQLLSDHKIQKQQQ